LSASSVFAALLYFAGHTILATIAHNIPAVYDGLAARIRKCAAFPWPTNCGCSELWERSVAERPRRMEPRAAYWRRSVNSPVMRRTTRTSTLYMLCPIPYYFITISTIIITFKYTSL
jgi:hypothetical protein